MNIQGMLPFENLVDDYIDDTGNHVLYRVTPDFKGNNLVASGVKIEGYSVEDKGKGICFNVYVYNVQPGVEINYANGDSWLSGEVVYESETETQPETSGYQIAAGEYILNTNSKKIHLLNCDSVKQMSPHNKENHKGSVEKLLNSGYNNCKNCIESINTYRIDVDKKIVHNERCNKASTSTEKYIGVLEILTGEGYIICDKCNPR